MREADKQVLLELAQNDGASFEDLVALAGLDPASSFRGADLSGVDFGSCALAGYDFTEADISHARLDRASVEGAIFDAVTAVGTRWPSQGGTKTARRHLGSKLRPFQEKALNALLERLSKRRDRALALVPIGGGRHAILEELIMRLLDAAQLKMAAIFVRNTAERAEIINRLAQRLPGVAVQDGRNPPDISRSPQILVFLSNGYGSGLRSLRKILASGFVFDHLFLTTLVGAGAIVADATRTGWTSVGAITSPPSATSSPEARRESRAIEEIFGRPVTTVSIQSLVEQGYLIASDILVPRTTRRRGTSLYADTAGVEEAPEALVQSLGSFLVQAQVATAVVLCRNVEATYLISDMLTRMPLRLPHRIVRGRDGRHVDKNRLFADAPIIIFATVTGASIELCHGAECVAAVTTLSSDNVERLALRPRSKGAAGNGPLILDYGGSFMGLPTVRSELDFLKELRGVPRA